MLRRSQIGLQRTIGGLDANPGANVIPCALLDVEKTCATFPFEPSYGSITAYRVDRLLGGLFDAVELLFGAVNRRQQVVELAADLAGRWPDLEPAAKRRILERLVNRIDLTQETLEIRIAAGRLLEILWEEDNPKTFEPALWDNALTGDAPVNLASACESASEVVLLDGAPIPSPCWLWPLR